MKKIKKNLKWITLIIVMIILIGGIVVKWSLSNQKVEIIPTEELELEKQKTSTTEVPKEHLTPQNIYVDIKGAIQNPGVYEIPEDKKVIDVVQLAGGFTEQADTSMVNLAKKVTNEMVVIIYTKEEVKKAGEKDSVIKIVEKECICPEINNDACLNQEEKKNDTITNESVDEKVNINNATIEELLSLSGIGESKAEAIIKYREENGNFKTVEELMEVPGIGEALYEKIKASITV